jgi:hypothetical protein
MISNKKIWLPPFKIAILSMTIFSSIFYLPYLFNREIASTRYNGTNGQDVYTYPHRLVNSNYGNSELSKWLIIVTTVIRGFVSLIIIMVIDILTAKKLRQVMTKKKRITSSNRSSLLLIRDYERIHLCLFRSYSSG